MADSYTAAPNTASPISHSPARSQPAQQRPQTAAADSFPRFSTSATSTSAAQEPTPVSDAMWKLAMWSTPPISFLVLCTINAVAYAIFFMEYTVLSLFCKVGAILLLALFIGRTLYRMYCVFQGQLDPYASGTLSENPTNLIAESDTKYIMSVAAAIINAAYVQVTIVTDGRHSMRTIQAIILLWIGSYVFSLFSFSVIMYLGAMFFMLGPWLYELNKTTIHRYMDMAHNAIMGAYELVVSKIPPSVKQLAANAAGMVKHKKTN